MQPFIGQVIAVGFNFAPPGWALCNGQLLSISQYDTLYNLLGTAYGGDGVNTFGVPDLRGSVAVGTGQGGGLSPYTIGQAGGVESVTLTSGQLPSHNHTLGASSAAGSSNTPTATSVLAAAGTGSVYAAVATDTAMASSATTATGGNQPHANIQPVLAINYIIATEGLYPSQS